MIRNLALALAATVAVGTASITVTTTEADAAPKKHWGGKHGKHWGGGKHFGHRPFYRPHFVGYGYGYGCLRERVVYTPYGPRVRLINVCR